MAIDEKFRTLIAIGASVTANCQPCLNYHVKQARDAGAESAEILEAIDVARKIRDGLAEKLDGFSRNLGEAPPPSAKCAPGSGCSC